MKKFSRDESFQLEELFRDVPGVKIHRNECIVLGHKWHFRITPFIKDGRLIYLTTIVLESRRNYGLPAKPEDGLSERPFDTIAEAAETVKGWHLTAWTNCRAKGKPQLCTA